LGSRSTFLYFWRWVSVLTTRRSPSVPTQMGWVCSLPEGSTVVIAP
jgi:hypothetical protein